MSLNLTNKVGMISLSKLLVSLTGFGAAMILSRYLNRNDYGSYRQVWLVYNTLVPLFLMGLPLSVNYFIPGKQKSDQKAFNIQTYFLLLVSGFVFSLVIYFSANFIGLLFNNSILAGLLQIFACIPIIALPSLYYQELLICLDRPKPLVILSPMFAILQLLSIVIPVFLGGSLKEIIFSLFVFFTIKLIIVSYYILKQFSNTTARWKFGSVTQQLKYSIPIGLSTIIGSLTLQIDKIFISYFFPTSNFATYANGAIEIPLIRIITGSVTAVLMPEFVKFYKEGEKGLLIVKWHNAIRKVALIILPTMFFFLLFATEIISLLFSKEYADSAVIFRCYLLALPVRITNFGMILLSMGLSTIVFRYAIYTLVINSVLNYIMIKSIGFLGPAFATVLSIYLIGFLQLNKVTKELNSSIKNIFPWKILLHIIVLSIGIGSLLGYIKSTFFGGNIILNLIFGGLLYSILFISCALFTRLITIEDIKIPLKFIKDLC